MGSISFGNFEKSLPKIIDLIQKKIDQKFLLFITLKEVIVRLSINSASAHLKHIATDIWNILFLNTEAVQQETIRNAIAECLSRLSQFDPRAYLPLLRSQLNSGNSNTRSTVLICLRHTFTDLSNQHNEFDLILAPLLRDFIFAIGDSDQVLII